MVESVRQELVKLISENPVKVIYHYTDVRALIGHDDLRANWATHVSRLNDAMEYEIGISLSQISFEPTFNEHLKKLSTRQSLGSDLSIPLSHATLPPQMYLPRACDAGPRGRLGGPWVLCC